MLIPVFTKQKNHLGKVLIVLPLFLCWEINSARHIPRNSNEMEVDIQYFFKRNSARKNALIRHMSGFPHHMTGTSCQRKWDTCLSLQCEQIFIDHRVGLLLTLAYGEE